MVLCGHFYDRVSTNYFVARCRYHCWSTLHAFLHSFCLQNTFAAIFSEFDLLKIKTKIRDVLVKIREWRQKGDCGTVTPMDSTRCLYMLLEYGETDRFGKDEIVQRRYSTKELSWTAVHDGTTTVQCSQSSCHSATRWAELSILEIWNI